MRITSIELRPVALILTIGYAVLGLSAFVVYSMGTDDKFILPLGIVLPLFHLNLNLSLARSSDLLGNAFLCLAAIFCYGLTGGITGLVMGLGFNVISKGIGGIDAKYFCVAVDTDRTNTTA